jgi:orotidine-5'-phosphate decarboxylase
LNAIEKYNARADAVNSLVCVGLDSDITQFPASFVRAAHPQFEFNRFIIDRTHAYAAAYKPNMAFYEARGEAGLHDLRLTLDYLHDSHPDILTICDAKRGDIGSTSRAYVTAIFDELGFDAVTLNPYLGRDALQPFLDRADKGCIILCRTSNPGGRDLQDLPVEGKPLWQVVAEKVVSEWNTGGNCMLVVGATYPSDTARIRQMAGEMTFLVPGVGAQGGDVEPMVKAGLNRANKGLVVNSSRGIIFAENPGAAAEALRNSINECREQSSRTSYSVK